MNAVTHQVNSLGYQLYARVVTVILATMQVCLALIVLDATRRITGLQTMTVRTPALQTRVGEVLIMVVHPAAIVIHKRCTLRPAPSVMTAIILVMGVARAAAGIKPSQRNQARIRG